MNTYDVITSNKSFSGVDMVATCQIKIDGATEIYTLGSMQTLSYSIHMQRAPIRSIGNINAKDYVMGPRTIAGSLVFAVFNKHFANEIMDNIKKNYKLKSNYTFLADELPPFNITISFANEYGAQSRMVLYGIRLVNEGQVMSVNDIYTENTYQFVATDIDYLTDSTGYTPYKEAIDKAKAEYTAKYDDSSTGKEIVDQMKDKRDKDSKNKKISIKVTEVSHASDANGNKGTIKISLSPWQDFGIVTIKGKTIRDININVAEYKKGGIYVSLNPGTYTAKYNSVTTKSYSDEKQFAVTSLTAPVALIKAAPIIEFCSDKKISVYANTAKHNKLKFAEVNGSGIFDWKQVDLKNRRVTLQGLMPETKYILYTFGNNSESTRVSVKTDEFFDTPYSDLKRFVSCNSNILQHGTIAQYIDIIEEAEKIAIADADYISTSIAIIKYKDKIQSQISSLKQSDFSTPIDYEKKRIELNNIVIMCYSLINIANMLQNDGACGMNAIAPVKPPIPELIDAINCVFLFGGNIEKLEFYRQYNKVVQFAAEVTKIAFFDYGNDKKGFRFVGKPGYNYYVYAFNQAGERSPVFQFYVMTDEEKAKVLNKYYLEKKDVDILMFEAERTVGAALKKLNINSDNYNRLLVETAKKMETNVFPAPTILDKTTEKITIDISNNEPVWMFKTEFYAVIADVKDALYKRVTYKEPIKTSKVEFSARYGGVKPDRMYAIWIENKDGLQVSPSITTATYSNETIELLNEEESIDLYRVQNIINQVNLTLGNKISITTELATAINNLRDDDTITYKNVFDKLTFNVLSYIPKLTNTDEIIRAIFESKMDIMYHIDIDFFDSVIVLDNTIKFSPRNQEYMISMYGINYSDISSTSFKIAAAESNTISYDRSCRYFVIFATADDVYTKSGMIFIDSLTNTIKTYKIEIGG